MTISSYQIHNVLRTYSKQLKRGLRLNRVKKEESSQDTDKIRISPEAKRLQVVNRVSSEILARIGDPGAREGNVENEILTTLEKELGVSLNLAYDGDGNRLVFKLTDPETGGTTRRLTEEESEKTMARLEDITKDVVNRTML